jgi:hypothetical protein
MFVGADCTSMIGGGTPLAPASTRSSPSMPDMPSVGVPSSLDDTVLDPVENFLEGGAGGLRRRRGGVPVADLSLSD